MSVITISREWGSLGSHIGQRLAAALGWRYVDRERIYRAARASNIPQSALDELAADTRRPFVEKLLALLHLDPAVPPSADPVESPPPIGGLFAPLMAPLAPTVEEYVRLIGEVIRAIADEGHVVIVGRGAQVVLAGRDDAFHVRITAPFPTRVERVRKRLGQPRAVVAKQVRASDEARAEYLHRFYHADWQDPLLYDMVLNTESITITTAVRLIALGWHETIDKQSRQKQG
nr:cytidylate kinase-like family protein [Ardenticatena sp.]